MVIKRHSQIHARLAVMLILAAVPTIVAEAQQGTYLSVGVSQWTELKTPSSSLVRTEVIGSDRGFELGAGYSINDRWSFEATYTKFDGLLTSGVSVATKQLVNTKVKSKLYTLSPVLDLPLSKRVSTSLKVGASSLHQRSKEYALDPDSGQQDTKTSAAHKHFFASIGVALPIKPLKSRAELAFSRSINAPKGFDKSINFSWRTYF